MRHEVNVVTVLTFVTSNVIVFLRHLSDFNLYCRLVDFDFTNLIIVTSKVKLCETAHPIISFQTFAF